MQHNVELHIPGYEKNEIDFFPERGCADLGNLLDVEKCTALRKWIDDRRPLRKDIFYSTEEEFQVLGRWEKYAPGTKDHNLLMDEKPDLSFIENNPQFIHAVTQLVGKNYNILKKSVIRSTPGWVLPSWIFTKVKDIGRPNLNPFIRPEYQDVQFFHATDFHQDKTRKESNFVTVYIYLDNVTADYSALRVLEESHKLGMTCYPHSLRKSPHTEKGYNYWFYSDHNGNHQKCREIIVTGTTGSIFAFHCLTLHGTVLNNSRNPRISLRYLVEPHKDNKTGDDLLAKANAAIHGPLYLFPNRTDVAQDGQFLPTGSSLLAQEEVYEAN